VGPEPIAGLRLSLASPEQIRSWSYGEVTEPETIDCRTRQPVRNGLFCERIFGPTRDWTCFCGKYKRARTPGFVCEVCGVEIAPATVRRERMGHIELAAPVTHPWFARYAPSIIAVLLDLTPHQLAAILAYACQVVLAIDEPRRAQVLAHPLNDYRKYNCDAGTLGQLAALGVGDVLLDAAYRQLSGQFGDLFRAGSGAAAIRERLSSLDLDALAVQLRQQITPGGEPRKKVMRRLQVVEWFRASGVDPAWMVLTAIPVGPPELRPLVPLDGGRFATSDLNVLYERVIHRNRRVKRFLELGAPEVMLNNEKRLLQDACDALFDNGHASLHRHPLKGSYGQPLKSLTDTISGKRGRLRRNLLGKRVDYSGRSVIVGDPSLRLHQCGLPTAICLELFKPFLIHKLLQRNVARSAREAKRMVERARGGHRALWDLLEEVMHEKVVLLNRAPTLHRLSIQAFEAVRVEGLAIRLHPLVCSAFNADFDGDQMAVHLPLSEEAQEEARALLLSTRNLRSPATGEPTISMSQEMVLGLFYLTQDRPSRAPGGRIFADATEARAALESGIIDLHTQIVVRLDEPLLYDAPGHACAPAPRRRVTTTAGRLIFHEALPGALGFRNYEMTKERLKQLVAECLRACGDEATVRLADTLKTLGFHFATLSGISFALSDIQVPAEKHIIQERAEREEQEVKALYGSGMITDQERDQQIIAIWIRATEEISTCLEAHLDPWGSLATIIKSGATKAKFQQIRQLAGIRGLMVKPNGQIIPIPVKGNYLQGQTIGETFTAASGARKGFNDRSRSTSKTGHLTRKLVEAAVEVWVSCADCGTGQGLLITHAESLALGLPDMRSRLIGRVLAEAVPEAGLQQGTLLGEDEAERLVRCGVQELRVRSPLTCASPYGICQRCYGLDLATGELVRRGSAVGIIAAQSIGEPGTQLTMRTFHSGGIAGAQGDITQGLPRVEELFEVKTPARRAVLSEIGGTVEIEDHDTTGGCLVRVLDEESCGAGRKAAGACEVRSYTVTAGARLLVKHGERIAAGTPLIAGAIDPRDLLAALGREAVARYLVGEVQRVFRGTGVYLHDKHVEVVVRQMLRFVAVIDGGDGPFVPGEIADRFAVEEANARLLSEGGAPALARPVVLGLTACALLSRSWLAAASFQSTSRVLTRAAIRGQRDDLKGHKVSVILAKPIPVLA
jgi:DNA-directed RNA polymerase subunit beta'